MSGYGIAACVIAAAMTVGWLAWALGRLGDSVRPPARGRMSGRGTNPGIVAGGRWWLSWYHDRGDGGFRLYSPWWVSGSDPDDRPSVCAAVVADSEAAARDVIFAAYDVWPASLDWRFCEPRADDWAPFCDRFPRADWMVWPA